MKGDPFCGNENGTMCLAQHRTLAEVTLLNRNPRKHTHIQRVNVVANKLVYAMPMVSPWFEFVLDEWQVLVPDTGVDVLDL